MKIDMHCHTTESDGTSTPAEVAKVAKQRGIDMLFITDHDRESTGVISDIKKQWIQTVPSIEISARNTHGDDRSFHFTYYAENIWKNISEILENTRVQKERLIQEQLFHLEEKWFFIDLEEFYLFCLNKWRKKEGINKWDIARYIVWKKENREILENMLWKDKTEKWKTLLFYTRCLKQKWDLYEIYGTRIEEYEPQISDIATLTKNDNGILSIAHPNYSFSKDGVEKFMKLYREVYQPMWINAIEINTRALKRWVEGILILKQEFWDNLQITFGSDCHHIGIPDQKHGDLWEQNPYIDEEIKQREIDRIIERFDFEKASS